MKRYGNLWPQVTDFSNLWLAARKAERGKRSRADVMAFNFDLETNLIRLQEDLLSQTYQPGDYRTFQIFEPKKRMISAAPYPDRVVHHALCNVIAPIFEATFTADSFANRRGYGTHRALDQFVRYARSSRYVLRCDIRKYFPSIDHEILKSVIRRKIKCRETLWLIETIIDASNPQEEVDAFFPGDDLFTPFRTAARFADWQPDQPILRQRLLEWIGSFRPARTEDRKVSSVCGRFRVVRRRPPTVERSASANRILACRFAIAHSSHQKPVVRDPMRR